MIALILVIRCLIRLASGHIFPVLARSALIAWTSTLYANARPGVLCYQIGALQRCIGGWRIGYHLNALGQANQADYYGNAQCSDRAQVVPQPLVSALLLHPTMLG